MGRFRLYTYDLWAEVDGGFYVNDIYSTDVVIDGNKLTNNAVLKILKGYYNIKAFIKTYCPRGTKISEIEADGFRLKTRKCLLVDEDNKDDIIYIEIAGTPFCEFRPCQTE